MHQTLLLCLALMLAVSLLVMVGQRLRIPVPIFLVLSGLAVSLVPGIPRIEIDPELIFLIFLPPLLYEAAWFTSWKEFWRWRRIILVLAFGLVIFTAFAVAYVSSAVMPGFTLALGFLLGGIISPPDAVAATSVLKEVNISKTAVSILEGESLVNDAASLIVFRFALAAILSGSFVWQEASVNFLMVTLLGVFIGLAVACVFYAIHRWLPTSTRISILLTFLAPYIMYMTAEEFHVSGVMAVVSGGLFLSNQSHIILNHSSRIQGTGMWATVVFALNGLVFILIGLELPVIINGLDGYSKTEAVLYALLITGVVIVTRMVFTISASYFTRFIGKYITVAQRNPGLRGPIVLGWAGMRGVVSLASALSVPLAMGNGEPFPHRNLILFITFVVILVTLVFQGLTLPLVIRWVQPKDLTDRIPEDEQESKIRIKLLKVALKHLQENYAEESSNNELVENLKNRMESDLHQTKRHLDSVESDGENIAQYNEIIADIIRVKRDMLHQLRSKQEFDDEVIRKEEARMDLEEEKIDHPIH
ncbi:Na+/H+ antiporter [Spirosoma sp. KCTC 42546]|uniref:Na+/H+ antiporter n=1 Tax=Spirosoma sp. KCTC 42546 TaxID=2520506 RepID=UPI001158E528|nr:Na+/H+ antiporter [Spirosoma sp. KCTC 42546]QDK79373.1 Na+/H+ antiporter [Spirosoma sp. KCTC 42546]